MFTAVCSAAKMASSSETVLDKNAERRKRVLLGPLPGDFLQVGGVQGPESQESADRQAALALQQQLAPHMSPASVGRLSITLGQAKLVKNYGMTRMDPYVRLRVGHCVYESHTDPNGGKNPRWNKIINSLLPAGVTTVYLEIFDECSFTPDELIAWAHVPIPPNVLQGETHEDWYPLNGKQGDGMEGMINLVFSYSLAPAPMPYLATAYQQPMMMLPNPMMGYAPVTMYQPMGVPAPAAVPQPPTPTLSEEELKQIHEMFPSVEKEVIKSVSEANRGNKDATVNSLLQMSE